jgi:hypothetical protein
LGVLSRTLSQSGAVGSGTPGAVVSTLRRKTIAWYPNSDSSPLYRQALPALEEFRGEELEGIVADTGELFRVLSLCREMPDARRVINELEMIHNSDGGAAE